MQYEPLKIEANEDEKKLLQYANEIGESAILALGLSFASDFHFLPPSHGGDLFVVPIPEGFRLRLYL